MITKKRGQLIAPIQTKKHHKREREKKNIKQNNNNNAAYLHERPTAATPLWHDRTWRGFWRRAELLGAVTGVRALARADHSSERSGRHCDDWSVDVTGSILKMPSAGWEKSWNSCFFFSNNRQWISDITPTNLGHVTRFLFLGHIIASLSSQRKDGFTKRASAHQHRHIHIHSYFFF